MGFKTTCPGIVVKRPYQAVGGVPTVPGGIADGSRCRRLSRGGRAKGRVSGDGRATGSATRASDRRQGPATAWDGELRPTRRRPSPGLVGWLLRHVHRAGTTFTD
eukprot:364839-Chlamydomonas_euryale.AAC.10